MHKISWLTVAVCDRFRTAFEQADCNGNLHVIAQVPQILTDYKISYDRNYCIENLYSIVQAQPILTKFVLLNSQPRTDSNPNVLRYVSTWRFYGNPVCYKSCIKSAQGMCNYKFSLTCKVWKHMEIGSAHYDANETCEKIKRNLLLNPAAYHAARCTKYMVWVCSSPLL